MRIDDTASGKLSALPSTGEDFTSGSGLWMIVMYDITSVSKQGDFRNFLKEEMNFQHVQDSVYVLKISSLDNFCSNYKKVRTEASKLHNSQREDEDKPYEKIAESISSSFREAKKEIYESTGICLSESKRKKPVFNLIITNTINGDYYYDDFMNDKHISNKKGEDN